MLIDSPVEVVEEAIYVEPGPAVIQPAQPIEPISLNLLSPSTHL